QAIALEGCLAALEAGRVAVVIVLRRRRHDRGRVHLGTGDGTEVPGRRRDAVCGLVARERGARLLAEVAGRAGGDGVALADKEILERGHLRASGADREVGREGRARAALE